MNETQANIPSQEVTGQLIEVDSDEDADVGPSVKENIARMKAEKRNKEAIKLQNWDIRFQDDFLTPFRRKLKAFEIWLEPASRNPEQQEQFNKNWKEHINNFLVQKDEWIGALWKLENEDKTGRIEGCINILEIIRPE